MQCIKTLGEFTGHRIDNLMTQSLTTEKIHNKLSTKLTGKVKNANFFFLSTTDFPSPCKEKVGFLFFFVSFLRDGRTRATPAWRLEGSTVPTLGEAAYLRIPLIQLHNLSLKSYGRICTEG